MEVSPFFGCVETNNREGQWPNVVTKNGQSI
jgi:hypothetical protein